MELTSTVLDTDDVELLSEFYRRMLGWPLQVDELPGWRTLKAPDGAGLAFQREPRHQRPVWPASDGQTRMQTHLDILVQDLEQAVAWAQECGAELAEFQPQEGVRVMQDPAGHPFCVYLPGH
jgi:catechol 2,3-dioxygenase-like lactoylglutathione lyase family enzyme